MCKRMLTVAIGLIVLTGCLPIELDVTPDGRVLIPRGEGFFAYHPATGEASEVYPTTAAPVFALSLGEGGGFIAVTQPGKGGMMGTQMTIERVNAAGEASRVHSASNITYAQVSPDGGKLSFTRLADQQSEGFDQNLPELSVVGADGSLYAVRRSLWPADGCFNVQEQINSGNRSQGTAGQLARCGPNTTRFNDHTDPADFFRIRTLSLTWRVPQDLLPTVFSSARLTFAARNVVTLTDFNSDPEALEDGARDFAVFRTVYYNLPLTRQFTWKLNVTH